MAIRTKRKRISVPDSRKGKEKVLKSSVANQQHKIKHKTERKKDEEKVTIGWNDLPSDTINYEIVPKVVKMLFKEDKKAKTAEVFSFRLINRQFKRVLDGVLFSNHYFFHVFLGNIIRGKVERDGAEWKRRMDFANYIWEVADKDKWSHYHWSWLQELAVRGRFYDIAERLANDPRPSPDDMAEWCSQEASCWKAFEIVWEKVKDISTVFCNATIHKDMHLMEMCRRDKRWNKLDVEPLSLECYAGNMRMIRLLVEDYGLDPSGKDNDPLYTAVCSRKVEVVRYLLKDERVNAESVLKRREEIDNILLSRGKRGHIWRMLESKRRMVNGTPKK
eukprot:TRINITY_DN867_c0_g2_i4.p1 TRINITY_DN867_c0_g2~~TRINITY_DN867_c0_g2_i4.p1  ORF type:complete len:333 (-),score=70.69 TRINITY_DN867_c0_g2_i4:39-1037(-)